MKLLNYSSIILVPLSLLFTGCNSTIYDIVEIEEPVSEQVSKNTDSNSFHDNIYSEIKQDLKQDSKLSETKFSGKQLISVKYAVQIGAFLNESNALNYMNYADEEISEDIYYKEYDGFYKVRAGNFNNRSDALNMLEKLQNLGYSDSFIVELKYYQAQDR